MLVRAPTEDFSSYLVCLLLIASSKVLSETYYCKGWVLWTANCFSFPHRKSFYYFRLAYRLYIALTDSKLAFLVTAHRIDNAIISNDGCVSSSTRYLRNLNVIELYIEGYLDDRLILRLNAKLAHLVSTPNVELRRTCSLSIKNGIVASSVLFLLLKLRCLSSIFSIL